ncbi:MAG: hypothetical protein LBL58_00175 [Tannerellaceae bacterium]|nr:hypothetical protein [Tannerellaceae bacterium]
MDYTTGNKTILYKHQWDLVHDPETMLFAGREDAEEGKYMVVYLKDIPDNYRNPDKTITFFTPALLPITLPADVSSVIFSTSDEVSSESGGIKYLTPIGSLLKFSAGNEQYTFRGTDIHFYGYFNEKDSAYADRFTKKLTETGGYGLIAYPFYENGQTGYKLIKAALNPNSNEIKAAFALSSYQGQGIVNKNVASLLDQISSSGQAIVVPQGASIHAPILPPLSNTALEFLQRNSTLTKGDQWTAPLFIAHAHQISQRPIYENCLNDFWQNLDNDLNILSDRKHSQDNVNATSEQQFQKAFDPSSFTGLFEDYNQWKKDIEKYRDYEKLVIAINKEIQEQNTPEKMLAWFKKNLTDAGDCLYDEIEWESRRIALLQLANGKVNGDCQKFINRLIMTTVRNGQSSFLYDLLKNDRYALFYRLWDQMNFSDFAEYVQNISTIVTSYSNHDNIDCQSFHTSFSNEVRNSTCFYFYNTRENLNGLDYKGEYNATVSRDKIILKGFWDGTSLFESAEYDPFTMMRFVFPKDNCIAIGKDITPKEGAEFYAPAFYGAWLIRQKDIQDATKFARILVDGAIIVLSVASAGSSSGLLPVLDVALAGISAADIVITISSDEISRLEGGESFLRDWETLYTASGLIVGGVALVEVASRTSVKSITLKTEALLKNFKTLTPQIQKQFIKTLTQTVSMLSKLKNLTATNLLNSNLIYKLSEVNFRESITYLANAATVNVRNTIAAYIITANNEIGIAQFAFQGEVSYLKLMGNWGIKSGTVALRLDDEVSYAISGSTRLERGSIELVIDANAFGWRVVPKNSLKIFDHLKSFNWSDDLLTKLESALIKYPDLSSEIANNLDLLVDFEKMHDVWYYRLGLARAIKVTGEGHIALPKNFSEVLLDLDDYTGKTIRSYFGQSANLVGSELGIAFETKLGEILENAFVNGISGIRNSILPQNLKAYYENIYNRGYTIFTQQTHLVTPIGRNPRPDFLFFKTERNLAGRNIISLDDVIYHDAKLYVNTPFSSSQKNMQNSIEIAIEYQRKADFKIGADIELSGSIIRENQIVTIKEMSKVATEVDQNSIDLIRINVITNPY